MYFDLVLECAHGKASVDITFSENIECAWEIKFIVFALIIILPEFFQMTGKSLKI